MDSYSCLETGRYRISLENLFRILQVLGTDIQQVWPGEITGWVEQVDDGLIEREVSIAALRQPPRIKLPDVIEAVCHVCRVSPDQLCSPSRRRPLPFARALATLLVKETPHLTLVEASRLLRRDVSSLSHSLRRLNERFDWDHKARLQARQARRRLNTILRRRAREQQAQAEELAESDHQERV